MKKCTSTMGVRLRNSYSKLLRWTWKKKLRKDSPKLRMKSKQQRVGQRQALPLNLPPQCQQSGSEPADRTLKRTACLKAFRWLSRSHSRSAHTALLRSASLALPKNYKLCSKTQMRNSHPLKRNRKLHLGSTTWMTSQ